MSKLNDNYKLVNEGKLAKSEFLRQARQSLPGYINQFTSSEDAILIFRNKGILTESVEYQCPGDKFPLDEIERGIRYELEQMEEYDTPTKEEYKKARIKAIENLGKDQLYYIKKEAAGYTNPQTKSGVENVQKVKDEQSKVQLHEVKDSASSENAQKLFDALMSARAKKAFKGRWIAKDANSVLTQVRNVYGKNFIPKGLPESLKYDVKTGRISDVWAREGAMTASDKARNTSTGLKENRKISQKSTKILKESITKVVVKLLEEAATANLAQVSDGNASVQGIPTIVNNLENIVTEIESFILKEMEKVQNAFDAIGNIKNEDGIPVGYKFTQPIMQAFQKDLDPVLNKISLENIKLPEAPSSNEPDTEELGSDPVNTDITPEEKATMFTPKGTKPNPLANEK